MDFPRGALVWLPTENVRVRELLVDHKIDRIEFAVTTFDVVLVPKKSEILAKVTLKVCPEQGSVCP